MAVSNLSINKYDVWRLPIRRIARTHLANDADIVVDRTRRIKGQWVRNECWFWFGVRRVGRVGDGWLRSSHIICGIVLDWGINRRYCGIVLVVLEAGPFPWHKQEIRAVAVAVARQMVNRNRAIKSYARGELVNLHQCISAPNRLYNSGNNRYLKFWWFIKAAL